jgi:hypothetical protein
MSPRKRARSEEIATDLTGEIEDEAAGLRDYVMARGAAAIAAFERAKEDVIQAMALFITPTEDKKGKERMDALDAAIESGSIGTRALEDAVARLNEADEDVLKTASKLAEPWEEEDDDEDGAD